LFIVFSSQIPLTAVTSVIDGLKRLYIEKLKPLEVAYKFNDFVSPLLVNKYLSFPYLVSIRVTDYYFSYFVVLP
jgi:hypothetical protein